MTDRARQVLRVVLLWWLITWPEHRSMAPSIQGPHATFRACEDAAQSYMAAPTIVLRQAQCVEDPR